MSNLEMSMNIKDTSDTMATAISMTPPTKFLMHWRKNGGVERIMGAPGKALNSETLLSEYKVRKVASFFMTTQRRKEIFFYLAYKRFKQTLRCSNPIP